MAHILLLDGVHAVRVTSGSARLDGGVDLAGADIDRIDAKALLAAATASAERGSQSEQPTNWEPLLQFLGLGAALAAWVAVVGGARVWATLNSAHVPAIPTLVGLGRDWTVVEGLHTLTFPVLLGAAVALTVYFVWRPPDEVDAALEPPPSAPAPEPTAVSK